MKLTQTELDRLAVLRAKESKAIPPSLTEDEKAELGALTAKSEEPESNYVGSNYVGSNYQR